MESTLESWEQEYARLRRQGLPAEPARRRFLHGVAGAAGIAAFAPLALDTAAAADKKQVVPGASAGREPWLTFRHVYEHLFPVTEDKIQADGKAPGARQINATAYLFQALQRPDVDKTEKEFIVNGVKWLNDFALRQRKKPFAGLAAQDREWVLRQIEKSTAGARWLSSLMDYLFEALLADPVYGGNPDGTGWKWLQHTPGFPRPPADKMYYKLT